MSDDRALEKVLDLRQRQEDKAMKQWADAQAQENSFRVQLERVREFKALYIEEMNRKTGQNLDMNHYLAYQGFIDKLEGVEERQAQALEQIKLRVQSLKQEYLKRRQDREIIESLIKKHREARLKKEAMAEAKLSDDLVSSKAARELIARALESG